MISLFYLVYHILIKLLQGVQWYTLSKQNTTYRTPRQNAIVIYSLPLFAYIPLMFLHTCIFDKERSISLALQSRCTLNLFLASLEFKKLTLLKSSFNRYPLELLPPQSDFQGKKFLRKNFHPFSGLDGGSSQQTVEVRNIFIHI